ncbi:hypothetical protein GGI04_000534 [Coemansia thaxteri]|uniref:polynucleotide adenylyltransferase n=1 Tax=Coemansia thaxteri TaxID=2663907 RepID=A0A9W8EFR4_9FUNG|nr:hypothetical protein H4R26_002680 [Coemansia thaxteri]KAJ2009329.1 hypothetical protein GGI04_000534 [Coemansia thaxteri]KAJ2474087.1 hypothetical protein GGI02_000359 [Coemansia sp. RSA 2322]KAJ2482753.1 hypothetical protein EV174_003132 [Coemansia sp. RSA 2320]
MAVDTQSQRPPVRVTEDYIKLAESSSDEDNSSGAAPAASSQPSANNKRKAGGSDPQPSSEANGAYQKCYSGQPVPPWLIGMRRIGSGEKPDINDMVNEEVAKFVDYISPTPEEHQMRSWVIERMQRILDNMKMIAVTPVAKCFGSFETRLYLPSSDIDMTIMLYRQGSTSKISPSYQTKESIRRYLYTLAKELKRAGFCRSCEVIANARVPIIKTHEMITGIAVDISINADSGVQSAAMQRSFSETAYPHSLRAVVLVIKQFLAQRSMNEVFTGGMGSYAITLLVVSMLQMHPRIMSGGLDIAKNLGVLLIEFFELYGKRFNYDAVCISVRGKGQYLNKRSKGFLNLTQPYLLSIEDPCDEANDVTKGTYGINRIKQTFGGAYDLLNNSIFAYHQTRKFGEPINDNLKRQAVATSDSNYGQAPSPLSAKPSKKRQKTLDGKAKGVDKHNAPLFNNDPWAPVSFLSSILTVDRRVIESRAKLVSTFYQGTLQKALGVQYQPQLTNLLKEAGIPPAPAAASPVTAKTSDSAQAQINKMDFKFSAASGSGQKNAPGVGSGEVVVISDDDC